MKLCPLASNNGGPAPCPLRPLLVSLTWQRLHGYLYIIAEIVAGKSGSQEVGYSNAQCWRLCSSCNTYQLTIRLRD